MRTLHKSSHLTHCHFMPFGAEADTNGGIRFRLWAPAARQVALRLLSEEGERLFPMMKQEGGWWERVCRDAKAGCRYSFQIDNGIQVPDPASRFQPEDVHGPSEVIAPRDFDWGDDLWRGRPWHEAVFYEIHAGTFSDSGDFHGIEEKLDHLAELGVTALQLMPLSDFPGSHDWGYNGALPFAPDATYGRPEELKSLVREAHARGLMVFLDVVFNHFGPEGNYLHQYAPAFFTGRHKTPWGEAINFDGHFNYWVRQFFIQNALYWLEEYQLDGLRLDAVHAIYDDSRPDILEEMADAVEATTDKTRHVHLVLENDNNASHYLRHHYRAQWNDDIHHCLHLLLTGESEGYYSDYANNPVRLLGRCLAEGFAYQGEVSPYREGRRRGEPSADLPPTAFVSFLQNHDQVGNRAFGERITELSQAEALYAATVVLLLAPQPPLLFMGQEWGTQRRFPFFCDFAPELARAVTEGRRNEFSRFDRFRDHDARARIPDPNNNDTFLSAKLEWGELEHTEAQRWLALHRSLLSLRKREIMPLLPEIKGGAGRWRELDEQGLVVSWQLLHGGELVLLANLSERPFAAIPAAGRQLYATHGTADIWPPWFVAWYLNREGIQ